MTSRNSTAFGDSVVEARDASRLGVDHLVQRFLVQPGRAVDGCEREHPPVQGPEAALQRVLSFDGGKRLGAARDVVREADRAFRVGLQQGQRLAPHGLGQRLRPQEGGADRVCLVHHGGPAVLIPGDGKGEAERKDQSDDAQERGLQHAEGLFQGVREMAHAAPEEDAYRGGTEYRRGKHERHLEGAEPEEPDGGGRYRDRGGGSSTPPDSTSAGTAATTRSVPASSAGLIGIGPLVAASSRAWASAFAFLDAQFWLSVR